MRKDRDRAEQLRIRLVRQYGAAEVVRRESDIESANGLAARIRTEQTGLSENLVVRLDDLSSAAP